MLTGTLVKDKTDHFVKDHRRTGGVTTIPVRYGQILGVIGSHKGGPKLKRGTVTRVVRLVKLVSPGVFLAPFTFLVAACGNEATPAPQPTPAATAIPEPNPTPHPTAAPEPAATATPVPEPTAKPTVVPAAEPTPSPTSDPADAVRAEVQAAVSRFGQAFSTADAELLASLFVQSVKTNRFSASEHLRVNGWSAVEGSFKGLLSLPPGSVSLIPRQGRVDLLSDEAALWTGHFILNIRPPEEPRQTVEGRMTVVLQKAGGKWLRAHMHTSALPQ